MEQWEIDEREEERESQRLRKPLEDLCDAAATGNYAKVKEIIDKGDVDVNDCWQPDDVDYKYGNLHNDWFDDGCRPLHYAMTFNHPSIVSMLLTCEMIKLDIQNADGRTPLHCACIHNNVECIKIFVKDTRCNQDIVNINAQAQGTALRIAAACRHLGSVWELVQLPGTDFGDEVSDVDTLMKLAREGADIEAGITSEKEEYEKSVAQLEETYKKNLAELKEKHDNEMQERKQDKEVKGSELKAFMNINQ